MFYLYEKYDEFWGIKNIVYPVTLNIKNVGILLLLSIYKHTDVYLPLKLIFNPLLQKRSLLYIFIRILNYLDYLLCTKVSLIYFLHFSFLLVQFFQVFGLFTCYRCFVQRI